MTEDSYESLDERTKNTLVYIAGPYTKGVPDENLRNAIDATEHVRNAGYTPFVLHLNVLWGMVYGHSYWLEWCLD